MSELINNTNKYDLTIINLNEFSHNIIVDNADISNLVGNMKIKYVNINIKYPKLNLQVKKTITRELQNALEYNSTYNFIFYSKLLPTDKYEYIFPLTLLQKYIDSFSSKLIRNLIVYNVVCNLTDLVDSTSFKVVNFMCENISNDKKLKQMSVNDIELIKNPKSYKLEDQVWIKEYFKVPICTNGWIQKVSSWSCRVDSILNLLFLTPKIADILMTRWNELNKLPEYNIHDSIEIDDNFEKNVSKYGNNVYMYILINNILIKNKKITTRSSIVKNINVLRNLLSTFLDKSTMHVIDYKELIAKKTDITNKITDLPTLNKLTARIDQQLALFDENPIAPSPFNIMMNKKPSIIIICDSALIGGDKKPINPINLSEITINNTIYNLESCIVSLNENDDHRVAGLKCYGKEYVLDSLKPNTENQPNVVTYDNWTQNNLDNYLQHASLYNKHKIIDLVYVIKDQQTGGVDMDKYFELKYNKYKSKYIALKKVIKIENI